MGAARVPGAARTRVRTENPRQSMRSTLAFVVLVCATLAAGCTRSAPSPPSVSRDDVTARSVFTDTLAYRRYCEVPAGQRVNIERPCLLLDQSRPVVRRPPSLIP